MVSRDAVRLGGSRSLMANPIIVIHNPTTLLHHSIELIGHKLIDAHESPDRISRILKSLEQAQIEIIVEKDGLVEIPSDVHDSNYISHLEGIFQRFKSAGLVEEDGCILPECFPHRSLLQFTQINGSSDGEIGAAATIDKNMAPYILPKDPFAHLGHYSFDMSTGMSKDTYQSVIAAVDLALKGVHRLLDGDGTASPTILALTRPPGHHACHALAGGYCYINNVAVAAQYALSRMGPAQLHGTEARVVILDLDFHHGNGTQSIFYSRREPAYVSVHGEGEYPYYTGTTNERGHGEGEGFNRNFPLPAYPSSTKQDYFDILDKALAVIRDEWRPTYLLLSLGFDTFRKDALGGFDLDVEDYKVIGERVRGLGLPVLVLLEGGYSDELGDMVVQFLTGMKAK